MPDFQVVAPFIPMGDQPDAIQKLVDGINAGYKHQTLLGATATGKTYVMSKLIEDANRPTLVLAHNKTLAAQLYQEFKGLPSPTTPSNTSSPTTTSTSPKPTSPAPTSISRRTRTSTRR